jgi:hypothetical protein
VFPSRVLLRRIADLSQGNALFALELGRAVRAAGSSGASPNMILPDTVDNAWTRVLLVSRPGCGAYCLRWLSPAG